MAHLFCSLGIYNSIRRSDRYRIKIKPKSGDSKGQMSSTNYKSYEFRKTYFEKSSTLWWQLLFSLSVVSNSLQPHRPQHARLPCPSPFPRACSNSCPLSWWCHPTILSSSPPAFNLSQHQGLFQWVGSLHKVSKVLEFSFSISPFNEYSGLISFRINWYAFLVVQGTLKSLLQHHSLEGSILWHSADSGQKQFLSYS